MKPVQYGPKANSLQGLCRELVDIAKNLLYDVGHLVLVKKQHRFSFSEF